MKTISNDLLSHISGEVATLATCWKLTRRDAVRFCFTDHDRDIVFEGDTYLAASGFTPSAIENSADLRVDNLDVEGMLSASAITEADILAGRYDFAEIEIFRVNYTDLSQGSLMLKRGWLGEVSYVRQQFVAEVRGLSQRLSQTVGELYSASCRATLGDSRCKVSLAAHTVTGAVTSASGGNQFEDTARTEAGGTFSQVLVTFTGGANIGFTIEVKEHTRRAADGQFTLVLPLPHPIAAGDTYSLSKGCDKTLATCHARFANVVNFRGEPLVPGLDRMLETAGTRSGGS
jgi:uncharacterized phage protein (TIGR02218 family)